MHNEKRGIPSGWQLTPFVEMADVSFSGVDKKTSPGEREVRLCNYTDVFHNHHIHNAMKFMRATASEREIENFTLVKGDVVFTKDSETPEEIAETSFVSEALDGVVCGYHLGIARPKHGVEGAFLFYAMQGYSARYQFTRSANGVTRFGLTLDALRNITLLKPHLYEQRKIAEILWTWDDAIRKVSDLIGLREIQYLGLRNKLIDWSFDRQSSLRKILKPVSRPIPRPAESYRALSIRSHGKGSFERFVENPSSVDMETLYVAKAGDLIVNITFAWEGAVALVPPEHDGCLVSHRFPSFQPIVGKVDARYLRHAVRTPRFTYLLGIVSPGGAGRNRVLNKQDFLDLEIPLPSLAEQTRIATILDDAEETIATEIRFGEALERQKRGLMQKLLTGEWPVTVEPGREAAE